MTKLRIYKKYYCFCKNNRLHSVHDIPSYHSLVRIYEWHVNDRLHRLNGPAVIYDAGVKQWYENGRRIKIEFPKR